VEVQAKLNNLRGSARKTRLVADQICGKGVEEALGILALSPKRTARPLAKLLRSALANAEQRNQRDKAGIDVDNLVVTSVQVNQGPSMWRVRPRAQGRATWIQWRSSHVIVVLAER
jgi:large subunit ribosomal protein L22